MEVLVAISIIVIIAFGTGIALHSIAMRVNASWLVFFLASIFAASASALILHIRDYWELGYVDPFYGIALVGYFVISLVVAAISGLLVRYTKKTRWVSKGHEGKKKKERGRRD